MSENGIYVCRVMHRRPGPPRYRFTYRSFYLLLDIDALDTICASSPLLSHNRFNLLSVHDADHGSHDGTCLRSWINSLLARRGIDMTATRVRLLTMPRVLGYGFNPISIFYCERHPGVLVAVVVEVHNTFGEHHFYVLDNGGAPMDLQKPHSKSKCFHVSPFLERQGAYQFRFGALDEQLGLAIRLLDDQGDNRHVRIATTLTGHRVAIRTGNILKLCLRIPLLPIKVIAAIYWQACKLWLRRTPILRKPQAKYPPVS